MTKEEDDVLTPVAKAVETAGLDYLKEHGQMTDWADVPDMVFARAAVMAFLELAETDNLAAEWCENAWRAYLERIA